LRGDDRLSGEAASARPTVWAIGGGKGGVGKSVITANLAFHLGQLGRSCVAIDADLGGANMHTVLGIPNPSLTLSDFISRKVASLSEIMVPTTQDNLYFISGSKALMEMANPKYQQKEKLIRHIFNLEVDNIILDLGSGSAFNTLDFFLAADKGIMVVLPEPTSVENAYHFMKAAFYRKLKKATRKSGVSEAIDKAMAEKVSRGIQSPRTLISSVGELDPEAGAALQGEADSFTPGVVVNQIRKYTDQDLGKDITRACNDYFGIHIDFLGSIEDDNSLREAVRMKRPMMEAFPASPFASGIQKLADALLGKKLQ
jgi:flagellar biosynthesis protein FlhG